MPKTSQILFSLLRHMFALFCFGFEGWRSSLGVFAQAASFLCPPCTQLPCRSAPLSLYATHVRSAGIQELQTKASLFWTAPSSSSRHRSSPPHSGRLLTASLSGVRQKTSPWAAPDDGINSAVSYSEQMEDSTISKQQMFSVLYRPGDMGAISNSRRWEERGGGGRSDDNLHCRFSLPVTTWCKLSKALHQALPWVEGRGITAYGRDR